MTDFTTVQSENETTQSTGGEDLPDCLLKAEEKIKRWQETRLEAGRAMRRIGEEGLYRERGYDTIEEYAESHFGISESRWHQLVRYAETYDALKMRLGDDCTLPDNESQSRPLQKHRGEPDLLACIWKKVVDRHGESLARSKIRAVVEELTASASAEGVVSGDGAPPTVRVARPEMFTPRSEESPLDDLDPLVKTLGGSGSSEKDSRSENGSAERGEDSSEEKKTDTDRVETESEEQENAETEGPLDQLRQEHPSLLEDLNDGVARGLHSIAGLMDGGEPGREELVAARESFESLSHREPPEESETELPGCITGDLDTVSDREILIAVPTEMVTPQMARKAVPVGVPQMQSVVGIPLSHFGGRPPMDEILAYHEEHGRSFGFTETNVSVDWAVYTINPLSGCLHTCSYCYARYQAETLNRYKQGFQPTFFPGRLLAFSEMEPPEETDHPRDKNVFVGSMSDVFGKWVPEWMIQSILDRAEANDGFDYLFLTKFPQKLSQFDFPDNAWVGTTVDKKHRVALAERHFQEVSAKVKWLSCEPLLENVAPKFDALSMFDCVVIGAQQAMGNAVEEKQPDFDWVVDLYRKAREAGCTVYFKENLDVFPKELPVSR